MAQISKILVSSFRSSGGVVVGLQRGGTFGLGGGCPPHPPWGRLLLLGRTPPVLLLGQNIDLSSLVRGIIMTCNNPGVVRRWIHSSSTATFGKDGPNKPTTTPAAITTTTSTKEENPDEHQKPSSKVEETVKILEKELEKKQLGVQPVKRPLYKRILDEILHVYHGFRLLAIDFRICNSLMWRVLNGHSLSRREYKQLIRTTADLFRLLPFSVFIIVPFMELLLPLFIKFFPNMLPSTFQTSQDRDSKMKNALKVKLEMAKFLQQTLDDMAPQAKGRSSQDAKEFAEFIQKIRTSGDEVSTEEILKFSKLFEDEITLDSLSRAQLMALCRLLEIPAIGVSTTLLRFRLRMRLRNLAADDKQIEQEGIDALNLVELQNACKARGMRAYGISEDRMRRQLHQWLTLSLNEKVPASLLLLTRAMYLPENLPSPQQLKTTLESLPDAVALQTKAAIGEREGKIDNKTRIELIKEEERKIKEERQEVEKLDKEEKKKKLEVKKKTPAPPAFVGPEPVETRAESPPLSTLLGPDEKHAPIIEDNSVTCVVHSALVRNVPHDDVPKADVCITADDLATIEVAIGKLGRKKMVVEREELRDLKEEMKDYKEDVEQLEEMAQITEDKNIKVKESKGARLLHKKLNKMVGKLEDTISTEDAEEAKQQFQKQLIATEELIEAVRLLKDVKDPAKLERVAAVLAKLDNDKDGQIEVDDLTKVIDIIGREHITMSSKQLEEIIQMLDKEEVEKLKLKK